MAQTTAVVLAIDQERRDDIRMHLYNCGVLSICFTDEWICLENIYHVRPDFAVFWSDSREKALRFIYIAKAIRCTFPVIVMSDRKEIESVVRNNWLVNLFFMLYPTDEKMFQEVMLLMAEADQNVDRPVLIAGAPESQKRIQWLPLFGLSDEPVLIQGEPGVGKRLMAKAIHNCMTADKAELRFINAGEISGRWIREIHQRFDEPPANGASVCSYVIKNIEALSIDLQSQLLLILEDPSDKPEIAARRHPIRLITLADADLEQLSCQGRFRKDLYHRLSVLKMTVSPLRERKDDVVALADFYATKYSIRNKGAILRLPDEVRELLKDYPWPGNVAELKRIIERSLAMPLNNWTENLTTWCSDRIGRQRHISSDTILDEKENIRRLLENTRDLSLKKMKQHYAAQVECRIMKAALLKTNGNCKKAAGLLNISYKSMLNKVREYELV